MSKTRFIAGGCSFTYGSELSDDDKGKKPSQQSWAYGLYRHSKATGDYICRAKPGSGNSGIARRVFNSVANIKEVEKENVVLMSELLAGIAQNQFLDSTIELVRDFLIEKGRADLFLVLAETSANKVSPLNSSAISSYCKSSFFTF